VSLHHQYYKPTRTMSKLVSRLLQSKHCRGRVSSSLHENLTFSCIPRYSLQCHHDSDGTESWSGLEGVSVGYFHLFYSCSSFCLWLAKQFQQCTRHIRTQRRCTVMIGCRRDTSESMTSLLLRAAARVCE
jgi:hypothetical protein